MSRGLLLGCVVAMACALLVASGAAGREIYVSPTGTPEGDGSKEKPLDIFTVLAVASPAKPGDTVLLMGGTYDGKMQGKKRLAFGVAVSGQAGNPVKIMPAPGESAHLNGAVDLTGSYVECIGLEIGDLEWDPWGLVHETETALWARGGTGAKIINCNIFGGAMGTGLWSPATNLTLYGCLVHDFGGLYVTGGRGHGHAFYTQNETGTKTISNCIAYRGCAWNLHVYTQQGQIVGFDVLENIMYIAGSYRPGQTMDNYLVSGYPPSDRIRLVGNVGYQPSDVEAWRPNARMGNYRRATNGTGEVKDNYFMGAFYGLSVGDWKNIQITGNTIWSTGVLMEIGTAPTGSSIGTADVKPDLAGYKVDNNTYFANGQDKPFLYGQTEKPLAEEFVTLAEWQKLGLDKGSKLLPGKDGKPTGTKVFVFPNQYEKGRANVGIFNWDGQASVEVDLSKVLENGQNYKVYNCLDIRSTISRGVPVLQGAYDGRPVALPMRKDPISPDFDAFLVLPAQPAP